MTVDRRDTDVQTIEANMGGGGKNGQINCCRVTIREDSFTVPNVGFYSSKFVPLQRCWCRDYFRLDTLFVVYPSMKGRFPLLILT